MHVYAGLFLQERKTGVEFIMEVQWCWGFLLSSTMQLLVSPSRWQVSDMLRDAGDRTFKLLLQALGVWPSWVENRFGLIVSLCTRGQDKVSDCMAPQLSRVCRATPLMAIYCFLSPENGEAEDNRIPAAVFRPPSPSKRRQGPKHSLNLSAF